jgi:amino acid adenylation domain-containing protein
MAPEDRHQMTLEWGTGPSVAVPRITLAALFEAVARHRRDALAVVQGTDRLTYGQLDAAATRLARQLCATGARPGRAVGVAVPRTPLMVVALLGALKAGAHYVPLDASLPAARLKMMLDDADPVACVVHDSTRDRLPVGPWRLVDGTASDDAGAPLPPARPDDLAYVIFTSGSTGRPKGVCVEHQSAVDLAVTSVVAYRAGPDDRMLSYASIGFDISVAEIFSALAAGATLVIADDQDRLSPDRLQALLVAERITIAEVPPALLGLLDPTGLPDLRLMIVGGEAPAARQVARWVAAGPRVINAYGPTETTVTATWMECTAEPLPTVPIGRPIANHWVYVLDERRELTAPGAAGELWIGGPGVARGYLGAPELTAQRFRTDPLGRRPGRMYRTGDRVRWNPDGTLEFLGRLDYQLNLRGFRIDPGDVESRLRAHPNIRAAAAATREHAGDVRLVAYVIADGPPPDAQVLADWCAAELPAAFVPSAFVVLDALPLDVNGKLDRGALPAAAPHPVMATAPPRTPVEKRLLEMWRELLPGTRIGIHDDLFRTGGHSLLAMRLLVRIRRAFQVDLSPRIVYTARTIAALATEIALGAELPDPVVPVARRADGPVALSQAQLQQWFVDQLGAGATYNLPLGLRLRGALDPDALERALGVVVARHATLRSSISVRDGQPVSLIDLAAPVTLARDDLRELPAQDREQALRRIARADADAPFALDVAPLWRARLTRLADEEWALIVVVHHIVADGWSLSVLLDEVSRCYAYGPDAAPPPTSQYGDYVAWEHERLRGPHLEQRLKFWRAALAEAPPALDLPTDRPRPPVQTHRPGRVQVTLPGDLARRVRDLADTHRMTPFVVLLSFFKVLLARLAGVDDVVVACPFASRPEPEFDSLIGLFVNTVPVRVDLSGDPTVAELLQRTEAATVDAFEHADVPFNQIVEATHPMRDVSRPPVAQIAFNLLNYPPERLDLPAVRCEEYPIDPPGALLDLTLYAREDGPDLRLDAVYNRDLFDRARIDALLDQYLYLIEQADGSARVGGLSLVSPAARRVLPDPTQPLSAVTGPTAVDRFRWHAQRTPHRPAVVGAGGAMSYAELDTASDQVAAYLSGAGVPPGAPVAVAAVRDTRLAVAILGVFKAGALACLLDPTHPAPRLVRMLSALAPAAWLAVDDAIMPAALTAHMRQTDLRCRVSVPGILRQSPTLQTELVGPALDDPAHALFTSGSTGTPNAVYSSYRPLAHFTDWYTEQFQLAPTDRFAVASGVAHDPVLRDLIVPLCVGATAYVPDPDVHRAPDSLVRWLREQRITVLHLTPQRARLLTQTESPAGYLPDLRLIATGGDVLASTDVIGLTRLAPDADIVAFYGATETPQAMACQRAGVDPHRCHVPLGHGIEDVQLLVLAGHGGLTGVGELGEIVVRSPHVALGYLGDEALTAARFTAPLLDHRSPSAPGERRYGTGDRRYRTGDLGRYLPDGRVEFAGRRDGQVKVRGYRVELAEVTAVLERHPQIRQTLVLAPQGPDGEPRLVAYVVPRPGVRPHLDELYRHANAALPEYAAPAVIVPVDRIPLGPTGKVDLAALPQPIRRRGATGFRPPRSQVERAVAQAWGDVLGIESVGLDDNFFGLGGSSMLLVRVQRLLAAVHIAVPVLDLFRYPTVRALAAHLADLAPDARDTGADAVAARVALRTDRRAGRTRGGRPGSRGEIKTPPAGGRRDMS